MTTESSASTRRSSLVPGVQVVGRAAGLTALSGLAMTLAAAVAHGGEAAAAAAVGAALVALVVSFGTASLHVVASAMPTASLVVALVTYATQLAIVLLVFLAITRGDLFASVAARGWLAAAMVGATLVWTTAHLVLTARQRVPHFDLGTGGESR